MKTLPALLVSFFLGITAIQAQWVSLPSPNFPTSELYSVEVIDANTVWAISPQMSVTKTTDGGTTWQVTQVNDQGFANAISTSLSALDANTAWLTAMLPSSATVTSKIYKTTDGGLTWQSQPTAYPNPGSYSLNIHFFDANNGVAVGYTSLLNQSTALEIITTADGGLNWVKVPPANLQGVTSTDIHYNTLTTVGNTVWLMGTDRKILKSTDKGVTWNSYDPGYPTYLAGQQITLAFRDANNGLASHNGFLKRTSDGGVTWASFNHSGGYNPSRIVPVPGTAYYVSGYHGNRNNGSYISYDNGTTWNILETSIGHFDLEFLNATTGFSGGYNVMHKFGTLLSAPEPLPSVAGNFTVSPNPGTGIFTISGPQFQTFNVEVYNLIGLKVFQKQSRPFTPTKIDLTNQPKGVYLVKILTNGQPVIRKIVLQ